MVSSPPLPRCSGSRNRDGTGASGAIERFRPGLPLPPGQLGRIWPKFRPVVTKFGREAGLAKAVVWWNVTFALGECDGEANSVGGLCRLHCCSTAGWCANSAGDTMSCCRALEYAEALDLSADRWAKMLVRRQEHDLEIIVAVAAASSRGPIDFRQSAGSRQSTNFRRSADKDPHSEVHQSAGCPGLGYGRLRRF